MNESGKQTFEESADKTIEQVRAIYSQRGQEYADSWSLDNLVTTFTEHTLRELGFRLDPLQLRLVLMAALVDVKDSRMGGPFKADSIIDGIAYRAAYCALREQYDTQK